MRITKLLFFVCLLSLTLVFSCKKDKDATPSSNAPHDFLSADKYDKLVIQIQAVSGYELTQQATDNLVAFLQQRLNKPVGIQIIKNSLASPGKPVFTLDDIKAIEKANRTEYPQGTTLTAYFFIADGSYSEDQGNSKVLGVTYAATSIVLFEKTIREFTGGIDKPSLATLETTSMEHEFGHLLGLVNNGTNMQTPHQDLANGKHCTNSNCLMYYNIETSASITDIFGGGIPTLDSNCLNDLKGNGGK